VAEKETKKERDSEEAKVILLERRSKDISGDEYINEKERSKEKEIDFDRIKEGLDRKQIQSRPTTCVRLRCRRTRLSLSLPNQTTHTKPDHLTSLIDSHDSHHERKMSPVDETSRKTDRQTNERQEVTNQKVMSNEKKVPVSEDR